MLIKPNESLLKLSSKELEWYLDLMNQSLQDEWTDLDSLDQTYFESLINSFIKLYEKHSNEIGIKSSFTLVWKSNEVPIPFQGSSM